MSGEAMLIDGIHIPLTAPFYRDGRSYLRKVEHNTGRYSLTPAAGLVVLGPGSEASALSDEETNEVLQAVGQSAAREKVLIAGIAKDSVRLAVTMAESAERAGFDSVLLAAPHSVSTDEWMLFFRAVADASPLPVLLWSDALSVQLSIDRVAELATHANIIGLYDADLSVERYRAITEATAPVRRDVTVTTIFAPVTRRMIVPESEGPATFVSAESLGGGAALAVATPKASIKTRTKTVGFQVLAAGDVTGLLPLLEAGVPGALPRLAACAPQACHEVFAAFRDGDAGLSAEKAKRLHAADELMRRLGIAGIKYGCDLNGYYGGSPRLPRLPLNVDQRLLVEAALRELRN
jgi:4-hydroxy-2-oxoglutarate aldolase